MISLVMFSSYIFGKNKLNTPETSVEVYQDHEQRTVTDQSELEQNEEVVPKVMETFKVVPADGKCVLVSAVTEELTTSDFWTKALDQNPSVIMNAEQISEFNNEIMKKVPAVSRLEDFKSSLSREELRKYITYYKTPTKPMYDSGGKNISQDFYNRIVDNTNLAAIKDSNEVLYGLCVDKASIRSFPTDIGIYSAKGSAMDRMQETGCEPCEPVIILHMSKDRQWYFIKMYNYMGWVKADSIAVASDKSLVFDYVNNKDFLMVTGKKVEVYLEQSAKEFALGTKLFVVKPQHDRAKDVYQVKIPARNAAGELNFTYGTVSKSQDVHLGYLPYTRYNIITEAFKFLGTEYDWGDKNSGRDCSSFILYIYKTFGFNLPRNTKEQEDSSNNVIKFSASDTLQKRVEILKQLESGDVVYTQGHTMMYLGEYNGNNYVIHSFYGTEMGDKAVKQVIVTPLNAKNITLLGKLTSAVKFRLE